MGRIPAILNGGFIFAGPENDGDAGQVLTTDGDGNLSLQDVPNPDLSDYVTDSELSDGLADKADDNAVVHLAGTETITGAKTFSSLSAFGLTMPANTGPIRMHGASGSSNPGLICSAIRVLGWTADAWNAAIATIVGLGLNGSDAVEINNGTRTSSGGSLRNLRAANGTFSGTVTVGTYTDLTLPTPGVAGRIAFSSDSGLVVDNGTNWQKSAWSNV